MTKIAGANADLLGNKLSLNTPTINFLFQSLVSIIFKDCRQSLAPP
nr:MAG TPA: hypothetical protein [Caudoviricetes sp.]